MPARYCTDAIASQIALRDNRSLRLRRPLPPLASAREHLEPLRALAHRIIARDYRSSSALPPDQGAKTRRCASGTQGGAGTALTTSLRIGAIYQMKAPFRLLALGGPAFEDGGGAAGFHAFLALGLDF